MTKTATPEAAVKAAQQELTKAAQELTEAQRNQEAARARLRAGDTAVTVKELTELATAVERAQLLHQAATDRHAGALAAERTQRIIDFKTSYADEVEKDRQILLAAMQDIEAAVKAVTEVCNVRHQRYVERRRALIRDLKVPKTKRQVREEDAGVGWSEALMGAPDAIHIDGRDVWRLSNPQDFIQAAMRRGELAARGRTPDPHHDTYLVNNPEQYMTQHL